VTEALHWFIPARRAVVRIPLNYGALINAWRSELLRCEAALMRWYDLDEEGIDAGLAAIEQWQRTFFDDAGHIVAPRDGEVTLDTPPYHFKPRLWKGPHRVLVESALGPDEPGDRMFEPVETVDPPLSLTAQREVDNQGAPLLMGDVVELPLFKFLAAAGRADFGTYPTYEDVFQFNPTGNYLLGTSLDEGGDVEPLMHDNLTAMRFQTLLGCMMGSFYHPEPVFLNTPRAVIAEIPASLAPTPAPEEPPDPLAELIADVKRVYAIVRVDADNLFKQELTKSEKLQPDWPLVNSTTRSKLRQWAGQRYKSSPAPRAFLYRINKRVEELSAEDDRSVNEEIELALVMDLHLRVIARLSEWMLEVDEMITSDEWKAFEHVPADFRLLEAELASTMSVRPSCGAVCLDEHARLDFCTVIKALGEKLAELEKLQAAKDPDLPSGSGSSAPAVHARGMIYAGTLFGASHRNGYKGPDAWHFYTNGWCRNKQGLPARCLATKEGLSRLPKNQPVTPGSVCSDTTLLLLNFMVRNHGPDANSVWGKGAVGRTMRAREEGRHYVIHDHYEYVPREDIAALAPEVTAEEQLAALAGLIEDTRALRATVHGETSFWSACLAEARALPTWSHISDKVRENLDKYETATLWGCGPPAGLMHFLSKGLKSAGGEAYDALIHRHDALVAGAVEFDRQLTELMGTKEWGIFLKVGTTITKRQTEIAELSEYSGTGFAGYYADNHKRGRRLGRAIWLLDKALKNKISKLEKRLDQPEKLKDQVGGIVDMSDHLGEVNNVSLNGHEWALVRLRSHDAMLAETELPRAGALSAFHPLSGKPFFDSSCHPKGQLYVFEQSSSLSRTTDADGNRHSWMGAAPFHWRKVEGNLFLIEPTGNSVKFYEATRTRSKKLVGITKLADVDQLAALHQSGPVFRPMLIHPTTKPAGQGKRDKRTLAESRMVKNGGLLYESRALPYPTLNEVRGAYAEHSEALQQVKTLVD